MVGEPVEIDLDHLCVSVKDEELVVEWHPPAVERLLHRENRRHVPISPRTVSSEAKGKPMLAELEQQIPESNESGCTMASAKPEFGHFGVSRRNRQCRLRRREVCDDDDRS